MRRIWSEFVPYKDLLLPGTRRLLRDRGIQLLVAVTPRTLGELPELIHAYRQDDVDIGLWPMLDDCEGRWANAQTAREYCHFCEELIGKVSPSDESGATFVFDIEPPLALSKVVAQGVSLGSAEGLPSRVRRFWTTRHRNEVRDTLGQLSLTLEDRGWKIFAALPPMFLADHEGREGWQWLLGTFLKDLSIGTHNAMCYSTLFEGYSRGLLRRKHSLELLSACSSMAKKEWGPRASVSLGCTGIGALGDEQAYRNLQELVEDVALVQAAGIDDIALFDLGGVLAQEEPERWLDALCETRADSAPDMDMGLSRRTRVILRALSGTSRALGALHRLPFLQEEP